MLFDGQRYLLDVYVYFSVCAMNIQRQKDGTIQSGAIIVEDKISINFFKALKFHLSLQNIFVDIRNFLTLTFTII